MGNVAGLPSIDFDKVKECGEEVMNTFTPIYGKKVGLGVVDQIKEEKAGDEPSPWQLLTAPIPSDIIMEGQLEKRGDVNTGWKKRYFRARNADQNFCIEYAEGKDSKKIKGAIQPCGYKVKALNKEEEVKEFGDNAFMLKPYGRRRHWYLRTETPEERKKWMAAMKYNASNAKAPLNDDPVLAEAFKEAYRETRWKLGVWGWYSYDRTEDELLAQLVVDRCEDTVLEPAYEKLHPKMVKKGKKMLQDSLDKSVGSSVGAAWKALAGATAEAKEKTLEPLARKSIGEVVGKQVELKEAIQKKLSSSLSGPLATITEPIMTKVCNCLLPPLVNAYKELMTMFHAKMTKIIADGMKESDIRSFRSDIRWWFGPMFPSLWHIYRAFRDGYDDAAPETAKVTFKMKVNIGDVLECFGDVSKWQIEDQFEAHLREQIGKAIYTFTTTVESDSGDADAALTKVMKMFDHDAREQIQQDANQIFSLIIKPQFQKATEAVLSPIIEEIDGLVPEALNQLLDVGGMCDDILETTMDDVINAAVEAGAKESVSDLDTLPSELGYA